jgi:hypothetical protein
MRRTRWILLFAGILLVIAMVWLWWVRPTPVDMSAYAPADSLLYLESNQPIEVVNAIAETQAWKAFESIGPAAEASQSNWLQGFIRSTGIGPIKSVILARAQLAVVVTDLRTAEEGETLNIKSEGALLIETHTAERRIRSTFEETLKTLAEKIYAHPSPRRVVLDGVEFSEWIAPEGSRQIVGTVAGSLIIIGTSEHIVQECLAVSQGRQPSLKGDAELQAMRLQLKKPHALTFGYVPSANSARLLAVGLPVLLGRAPGDSEIQRLITNGASKVLGSLAWSSNTYLTGIEDRYLITLRPSIVAHLKPNFGANSIDSKMRVPNDVYSLTSYKFADPGAVLVSLKTAVSSQVDALSTIVFSSLLRSALLSYGIDDPDTFLRAVNGELLTVRLDEAADRALLIGTVRDRSALRQLITQKMSLSPANHGTKSEMFEDSSGEFAASLSDDLIVIGAPSDVRRYSEYAADGSSGPSAENLRRMTYFATSPAVANVITYTDDGDRVRDFVSAIVTAKGGQTARSGQLEAAIATLPYSVTETTLGDRGIERTTRSPLGQFSTLLPLLFPQPAGAVKDTKQPGDAKQPR